MMSLSYWFVLSYGFLYKMGRDVWICFSEICFQGFYLAKRKVEDFRPFLSCTANIVDEIFLCEANLGERLVVYIWKSKHNQNTVNFELQLQSEKKVLYQCQAMYQKEMPECNL